MSGTLLLDERDSAPLVDRYSILPAISLDGVLHLDILTCSWTGEAVYQFVEVLLRNRMQPFPHSNSVLVMDNASQHHVGGLQELVEH